MFIVFLSAKIIIYVQRHKEIAKKLYANMKFTADNTCPCYIYWQFISKPKYSNWHINLLPYSSSKLSHHHIKHHHQHEADSEANGAEVGVLTAGGFGYELLDYDVEHGPCGKGQHVRKHGHQQ